SWSFCRMVSKAKDSRHDGKYLGELDYYDTLRKQNTFESNVERYNYWLRRGAQPSETAGILMKKTNRLPTQRHKIRR
ncbi:MAG: hypothetical protein A2Y62_11785, partial [Candidatus Fischerbacteria bacterium RBG_13_37_8]